MRNDDGLGRRDRTIGIVSLLPRQLTGPRTSGTDESKPAPVVQHGDFPFVDRQAESNTSPHDLEPGSDHLKLVRSGVHGQRLPGLAGG